MKETNGSVYTTTQEQISEFTKVCTLMQGTGRCDCALKCEMSHPSRTEVCVLDWLKMPAKDIGDADKCPYCGAGTVVSQVGDWFIQCNCGYRSPKTSTRASAILMHNELCRRIWQEQKA